MVLLEGAETQNMLTLTESECLLSGVAQAWKVLPRGRAAPDHVKTRLLPSKVSVRHGPTALGAKMFPNTGLTSANNSRNGMVNNELLQRRKRFGRGLDGHDGDNPSPSKTRQEDLHHGHRAKYNENNVLQVMRNAGGRPHHTLCIQHGTPSVTRSHRKNWRKCRDTCPIDSTHEHSCQPCLDLHQYDHCSYNLPSFLLIHPETSMPFLKPSYPTQAFHAEA